MCIFCFFVPWPGIGYRFICVSYSISFFKIELSVLAQARIFFSYFILYSFFFIFLRNYIRRYFFASYLILYPFMTEFYISVPEQRAFFFFFLFIYIRISLFNAYLILYVYRYRYMTVILDMKPLRIVSHLYIFIYGISVFFSVYCSGFYISLFFRILYRISLFFLSYLISYVSYSFFFIFYCGIA